MDMQNWGLFLCERWGLVGHLAFMRQSTGEEAVPMSLLFLCFALLIGRAKWGDKWPYLCAKNVSIGRLIKLALSESMLAFFFLKSVRLETGILKNQNPNR